jgi:hypothetical protein
MKKLVFSLAILASVFTSCSDDDSNGDDNNNPTPVQGEITGEITQSRNFAYGNYTLKGIVRIKDGATVTFAAGSTITANVADGVTDAIVVEKTGKLFINGTADAPVVFTEASQTPGSWGGILIYGDAPIVAANGNATAVSEDGLSVTYGGQNPTHSSGELRYARVEYAGKKILDGTSEMNGFSFYAVGSGTVLENLVSYKGADDGYEFYGGTVSGKNLISYGNFDDSFDWQDGWRGQNNMNWYAYQTGTGNFGMEIEAKSVNNDFWPVISGITLTRANGTVTESGSTSEFDAIQFKKEGNGNFSNIVITGYTTAGSTAVRIQDAATNDHQVTTGKIKLTNVKINSGTSQFAGAGSLTVNFPANNYTTSNTATGASIQGGAWATVNGVNLIQ